MKVWNRFYKHFGIAAFTIMNISMFVLFFKLIDYMIVISYCTTLLRCHLEQKSSINTVMWCEGKTTWAVIMSSLKTQILSLPMFLFQLLSPSIISSECPEKSKVPALTVASRSLLQTWKKINWTVFSFSAVNGYEMWLQVSRECVEKRAKESGRTNWGTLLKPSYCVLSVFI